MNSIQTNKKVFPCECPECQGANGGNLNDTTKWNKFRRAHAIAARDKHVQEPKDSIKQNNMKESMFDKIIKSKELTTLKGFFLN